MSGSKCVLLKVCHSRLNLDVCNVLFNVPLFRRRTLTRGYINVQYNAFPIVFDIEILCQIEIKSYMCHACYSVVKTGHRDSISVI